MKLPIEPTTQNIEKARQFVLKKWIERHYEREGSPDKEPIDLSSSCKFTSLFAQRLFGGEIKGSYDHWFVSLGSGQIIDLNSAAADVRELNNPYRHDRLFWKKNTDIKDSMNSCLPRVNKWVEEFVSLKENSLRSFVSIVEDVTPNWFRDGNVINILGSQWDAAEFLEGEEFDYEWRYCMVPASIVTPQLLVHDPEESARRQADIRQWAQDDLENRLTEHPPVAIFDGDDFFIADGNHRVSVAIEYGLPTIPMLVAIGEIDTPNS